MTRNRLNARRLAVLMVCLAGLLVGCDRTPEPTPPTVSTVATSSTASPTGTTTAPTTAPAPTTPTLTDDEQAIQAVTRFYEELNTSLRTLATGNLRTVFRPGCLACEAGADKIDQTARAGRTIVGGNYRITNLLVKSRPENKRLLMLTGQLTGDRLEIRDASGRVLETEEAVRNLTKTFEVFRSDQGWIVSGVS